MGGDLRGSGPWAVTSKDLDCVVSDLRVSAGPWAVTSEYLGHGQ